MQFITVHQEDHENHEATIHFLQWTGNEKELVNLWRIIQDACGADPLPNQEHSEFQCEIIFISEAAVDEMMKLNYNSYGGTFQKYTGVFKLEKHFYVEDPDKAQELLNTWFHEDGFKHVFTKSA